MVRHSGDLHLVIGFRFYARLIQMKIVRRRDDHATPAEVFENDTDDMPTDRRVLFGHHFAAIAGAGPLVGPVLAAQMGYLPGTMWILIGVVFAGAVQDFMVLGLSLRHGARSLGQMVREELGDVRRALIAMIGVLRPDDDPAGGAGAGGGGGVRRARGGLLGRLTIPIALFMGVDLRLLVGRGSEVSVIRVASCCCWRCGGRLGSRASWGRFTVSAVATVTVGWCRSVSMASGERVTGAVAAARAARLPVARS